MTSLSEFLRGCHSDFDNLGFDRAAFMALLNDGNTSQPTPDAIKWERGLRLRQWFTVFEAACIIEGIQPDDFNDYSSYNIPSLIGYMEQAIQDSLHELEVDQSGRIHHDSIDAWCMARGLEWPLRQSRQVQPATSATDAANLAQRLAEAEQKAARLEQELAAATAKADELQSLLSLDDDPDINGKSALASRRIRFIIATAKALGYEPLAIPDGGKAAICKACEALPTLFTESTFGHAWKAATGDHVRMANHEKFARRG